MSQTDDDLVYDGELGWIDPADPLGSLGVEVFESPSPDALTYIIPVGGYRREPVTVRIPRDRDMLPILRAILDDAEHRIRSQD